MFKEDIRAGTLSQDQYEALQAKDSVVSKLLLISVTELKGISREFEEKRSSLTAVYPVINFLNFHGLEHTEDLASSIRGIAKPTKTTVGDLCINT